jgi:hypothetical protein
MKVNVMFAARKLLQPGISHTAVVIACWRDIEMFRLNTAGNAILIEVGLLQIGT